MKVVDENSEADIARQQAKWRVDTARRNLAGNLIRVVRGAGRAWDLPQQTQELLQAFIEYQEAAGHLPSSQEMEKALSIDIDRDQLDSTDGEYRAKVAAREMIIGGALRMAAARILDQRLQVVAGEKEFDDGLRYLEQARETLRNKRQAEQAQWPLQQPPRPKKPGEKKSK
jgi:hypothetical protein